MDITIYQVNMSRDKKRVAFQNLDSLERAQESAEIDSRIYDRVFEGTVNCETLEDVLVFLKIHLICGTKITVN